MKRAQPRFARLGVPIVVSPLGFFPSKAFQVARLGNLTLPWTSSGPCR